MNKKCICIKDWQGLKIGDEVSYCMGDKACFVAGFLIDYNDFKECFQPIN